MITCDTVSNIRTVTVFPKKHHSSAFLNIFVCFQAKDMGRDAGEVYKNSLKPMMMVGNNFVPEVSGM
jgi:hypothetical protein